MITENRGSEAGGCAAAGNDGLVVIFERLLLARAMTGFRPVLYVSSWTDLHCSVLMLLPMDDTPSPGQRRPIPLIKAHG